MIDPDVISLLLPLALTSVIEALVFYLSGVRTLRIHSAVLLINCITNPVLTVLNSFFLLSFLQLILAECAIVCIEYGILRLVLRARSWRWFTLVVCANTISFSAGLLLYGYLHPAFFPMIRCSFTGKPVSCLQQWITHTVMQQPDRSRGMLDDVYSLWPVTHQGQDRRSFSDTAHSVGAILSSRYPDLSEAVSHCSREWFSGCIHGAVMEHIRLAGIDNSGEILNVCRNVSVAVAPDCFHGAGHAMWEKSSGDSIHHVLSSCANWSGDVFSACVSGVLMEYSVGDPERHSHDVQPNVYSRTLPCESLDVAYQPTCYAASASYMTYSPGDSFIRAEQYCREIPARYQKSCLFEISRRRILSGL